MDHVAHRLAEPAQAGGSAALPGWRVEPWDGGELPPEEGSTYYENARVKARRDAPPTAGRSARTLGSRSRGSAALRGSCPRASQAPAWTVEKLLAQLDGVTGGARAALRLQALVALSPRDEVRATGILRGRIADEARGSEEAGYGGLRPDRRGADRRGAGKRVEARPLPPRAGREERCSRPSRACLTPASAHRDDPTPSCLSCQRCSVVACSPLPPAWSPAPRPAAIWWWVDDGETVGLRGSDAAIAPPDYAYLDSARVALYLGQLEGGLAESEKLTEQLTENRNASVAASGFQIGGSAAKSSAVERVVTPSATARFYPAARQPGLGFLRTVDAAAGGKALARSFADIPEGSFVRLRNCSLRLRRMSSSVRAVPCRKRISLRRRGTLTLRRGRRHRVTQTVEAANFTAGRIKGLVGTGTLAAPERLKRRLAVAAAELAQVVRQNPRVPASCREAANPARGALDLLVPIRLGEALPERSLPGPGPSLSWARSSARSRTSGDACVDNARRGTTSPWRRSRSVGRRRR